MAEPDESSARWPQKGDSLFVSGMDWETEALLDAPFDWFLRYATSYKHVADTAVTRVEAHELLPDSVAFAVFYLYRHYIEVMLKGLIRIGHQLRDGTTEYPKHHRIRDLWLECRPLLEYAYQDGDPADTKTVEDCIFEFAAIDPSGEASRYGEDKSSKPTFTNPVQISLTNMRDVMGRLSGFIEGNYDYMYELLQFKADMNSEAF
jgi:hypothetical protein